MSSAPPTAAARRLALLLGAALLAGALPAGAQERPEPQTSPSVEEREAQRRQTAAALDDLRGKIGKEETRLASLRKREDELGRELKALEQELDAVRGEQAALAGALEELEAEGRKQEQSVRSSRQKVEQLMGAFRTRLVAMYKTRRRTSSLDYVFSATSSTDLLKRVHYLGELAEHDQQILSQLGAEIGKLQANRRALEENTALRKQELERYKAVEAELEQKRVQQAALLREEREKQRLSSRSIAKLRESAKNLESVLSELTGEDEQIVSDEPPLPPEPDATPAPAPEPVKVVRARTRPTGPESPSGYDGPGLLPFKGALGFPVEGKLLQRFGKKRHDEFADILFAKGLEVAASPGGAVRAVSSGKVVLSKTLPGYGTVIILDHGKRFYTLYARLASALAEAGSVVKAGETIARLGEADRRGRNFYFELRIKGKATDPASYFKSLPPVTTD